MTYLRAFFSFGGRMNRADYIIVLAIGYLAPSALLVTFEENYPGHGNAGGFAELALVVFMIWVFFAAMAKRFHDMDWSGASCLLVFVPLVGILTPYPGTDHKNQYGPPQRFF